MFKNLFKVKVVAGDNGEVIRPNPNKPEYGSIGFEQNTFTNMNGFLNKRRKVSFLAGSMTELQEFVSTLNLKPGQEVPGCLHTVESFEPLYEGQAPKINPTTGRAVLVDGAQVWEKTYYDPSGEGTDKYFIGKREAGDVIAEPKVAVPGILSSLTLSSGGNDNDNS
jgi:hypothetical protein